FYISDWVDGWGLTGKGRIWKLSSSASSELPASAGGGATETRKLLAEGFAKLQTEELVKLLEHKDMRVSTEERFALVERQATNALREAAIRGKDRLTKMHAIWGIGQIGRRRPEALMSLMWALDNSGGDAEVQAQIMKVLGDSRKKNVQSGKVGWSVLNEC